MANHIEEVCDLAVKAGRKIMRFYKNSTEITLKKDASPLTAADRASHEFLMQSLQELTPAIPVISEESDQAANGASACASTFWLVDPLDGTKEFMKGTDEFTVNIALVEAGRPVLGVVHAPALNLTYYGGQTIGAWRRKADETPVSIVTRKANGSKMAVVASKDHAGPRVGALLSRLKEPELRSMGSSLKFCLVAEGKADLYLRDLPTMEWDTAATLCIVESAGGGVYSLDCRRLRYSKAGLKNIAIKTIGNTQLE